MRRIIFVLIAIFGTMGVVFSQQKPDTKAMAMLDKAAKKLNGATYELTVKFSIKEPEQKVKELKRLTVRISSDKLYISDSEMTLYFDGKTQWVYQPDLNEVTISEPTKEELMEISPIAIINQYKKSYRALLEPSLGDSKTDVVTLLPKRPGDDIFRIRFYLSKQTSEITRIESSSRSGQTMYFDLSGYKKISASASTFKFNKSKYPKVSVNDMR